MIKVINKRLRNKKGFTLVELIVVIAVLGILSAIAIPKFTDIQDDAKENVDEQNIKLMQNAVEMYAAKNGNYPSGDAENIKNAILEYIDKIPEPQRKGYFYYNKKEHKIEYSSSAKTEDDWEELSSNN